MINQDLQKRIYEKKLVLDNKRPISISLRDKLHEQVVVGWTYNSNAIEGTTLSLSETELIIDHGLTIKGKPLKEHYEVINHRDAIYYIEELISLDDVNLTPLLIRQIHQIILKNIDDENAGKYREVNVQITGSNQVIPSPAEIPSRMDDFGKWLSDAKGELGVIEFAAIAHYKLANIHPFIDGNGRTSRLLMNLILMDEGFPPTVVLNTDRKRYIDTLNIASRGDLKPFVNFMAQSVERSLSWYIDAITPEKEKIEADKWRLLSELADESGYSQEYLGLLARRGKIEAIKKNRNWYSTLNSIEEYKRKIERYKN